MHQPNPPSDVQDHPDAIVVQRIEEDLIAQRLDKRHTFVPLRCGDLNAKLSETLELTPQQQRNFDLLVDRLQAILHAEHLSALLRLEDLYGPLDPDDDALEIAHLTDQQRDAQVDRLIDSFSGLLYSAHYKRLSQEEIESAVQMGSQWSAKLEVDFQLYDRLEIFARGYRVVDVSRRRWQTLYRKEVIHLPELQRLIMIFRLRPDKKRTGNFDPHKVYLKTFKNIPETDLEMLLPGAKIKLSMIDRGKIILPTLSGMAITVYKLIRGLIVLTLAVTVSAILAWVVFVGAVGGYIIKSVLGYFRTKNNFEFGLTRSLYLKNLDNNSSVLFRILHEAEEQELMESILCYLLLWNHVRRSTDVKNADAIGNGIDEVELDQLIERWLWDQTQIDVDFEIHDALGKLARLGLTEVDSQGRWTPIPLANASLSLDENWEKIFRRRPLVPTV